MSSLGWTGAACRRSAPPCCSSWSCAPAVPARTSRTSLSPASGPLMQKVTSHIGRLPIYFINSAKSSVSFILPHSSSHSMSFILHSSSHSMSLILHSSSHSMSFINIVWAFCMYSDRTVKSVRERVGWGKEVVGLGDGQGFRTGTRTHGQVLCFTTVPISMCGFCNFHLKPLENQSWVGVVH